MPGESDSSKTQSTVELELYFLIAKYLSNGKCERAAQALREELEQYKLLPKRLDWSGNEHPRSLDELVDTYRHVSGDHLLKICQRIGPILDKEVKPTVMGVASLLGTGRQSLLRTKDDLKKSFVSHSYVTAMRFGSSLPLPPNLIHPPNTVHVTTARELSGPANPVSTLPISLYSKKHMHCRMLGHLSSVYCCLFDRTGRYIFTGADDLLVKIWSAIDGRLLATLRGHSAEITDMAVNYENSLLAAGSCDKIIRVWCIKSIAPVAVLVGHTGMVTSLQFCPCPKDENRYLISTGCDGCICFWQWNVNTSQFNLKPMKFTERSRPGAQMICSSFSPGGIFLATGSTDHHVRVYNVYGQNGPEKVLEIEAHTDRVDSIQISNYGDRIISGSKDGTANVWKFEKQEWKSIQLKMSTRLPGTPEDEYDDNKIPKYKVTMVAWSRDDRYVFTAVNDATIKVWNSYVGELVYILDGHDDDVYVLETHPQNPRLLLSAGHDGRIVLWNLSTGSLIKSFFNNIEGQGHGAVFDCKFSPDGSLFASTDSHGHLSIFGFGSNEKYKKCPPEQFFHTDYRPLIRDSNHHVLDEQTQQAPHLMPPPFLVDIDGNPYPPHYQRLVPGRENCNDSQLVPHIVDGQAEVLEPVRPNEPPEGHRPSLDEMIVRLQQETNRSGGENSDRGPLSPTRSSRALGANFSPTHGRVGMRRSGDIEGVRQSHGNWTSRSAQGEEMTWSRRVILRNVDHYMLKTSEETRLAQGEAELGRYRHEKKRRALTSDSSEKISHSAKLKQEYLTRRKRRHQQQRHGYRTRAARTHTDSDFENLEDINLSSSESDSSDNEQAWKTSSDSGESSSESTEYSDWTQDAGINLQPPKRISQQRKRKVRKVNSGNNENKENKENLVQNMKINHRGKPVDFPETVSEIPEAFRPAEWLTEVIPRKTPYYPQMGDEVIYFRQGHECYTAAVKRAKVYEINVKSQPWQKMNLRDQELVKVVGIKYEIRPPRLCCLKLAMIDPETGKITGSSFTIKYHDMPDVIDFLVLRQTYDTAMSRNWKADDQFRSMIDDAWWTGTIESQEPFQEEYPDSMFQCFNVRWDNGEREKMSPWDLELIDEQINGESTVSSVGRSGRKKGKIIAQWLIGGYVGGMEDLCEIGLPNEPGGSAAVLPEELQALLYTPCSFEWPDSGPEEECVRIIHGLEQIMELSIAEPFLAPVDLNAYPAYAMVVEYPIDLSTIKARLENRFYRRITSLQFDIRYIETNAAKFNEPKSRIVKQARIVNEVCLRFIQDVGCTDVKSIYQDVTKDHNMDNDRVNESNEEEKSERSDSDLSTADRIQLGERRARRKQRQSVNSQSWKQQSKELLDLIYQCGDSAPFQSPVDLFDYPDYREIIDTPMDFGTVREQLFAANYENPTEFCKDVRLIFQNSRNFNTNKKSRVKSKEIYSMSIRLSAMFEEHIRGIINDWRAAVKYEQKMKNNKYVRHRKPIPQTKVEVVTTTRSSSRNAAQATALHNGTSSKQNSKQNSSKSTANSRKTANFSGSRTRSISITLSVIFLIKIFKSLAHRSEEKEKISDEDSDDEDVEVDDDDEVEEQDSEPVNRRDRNKSKASKSTSTKAPVKKPVKKVAQIPNGHARKTQRVVKNYSKFDDSSDEEEENSEEEEEDNRGPRRHLNLRRKSIRPPPRKNPPRGKRKAQSDSGTSNEDGTNESKSGSSSSSSDESRNKSDNESEAKSDSSRSRGRTPRKPAPPSGSGSGSASDAASRSASGSGSGSSSRSASRSRRSNSSGGDDDGSDEENDRSIAYNVNVNKRPITRSSAKAHVQDVNKRESPQPRSTSSRKRYRSESDDSYNAGTSGRKSKRIATRNQGKRTVRYREDSDFDYECNSNGGSSSGDEENAVNVSSRGRIRKLTARARAFIRE
uniref:Bromo domain-containing protein n=1 Tax=Strigamia maritima TaxID=126957 RepID=T1J4N0_STRMM